MDPDGSICLNVDDPRNAAGQIATEVSLVLGPNPIEIEATDLCGHAARVTHLVELVDNHRDDDHPDDDHGDDDDHHPDDDHGDRSETRIVVRADAHETRIAVTGEKLRPALEADRGARSARPGDRDSRRQRPGPEVRAGGQGSGEGEEREGDDGVLAARGRGLPCGRAEAPGRLCRAGRLG